MGAGWWYDHTRQATWQAKVDQAMADNGQVLVYIGGRLTLSLPSPFGPHHIVP